MPEKDEQIEFVFTTDGRRVQVLGRFTGNLWVLDAAWTYGRGPDRPVTCGSPTWDRCAAELMRRCGTD